MERHTFYERCTYGYVLYYSYFCILSLSLMLKVIHEADTLLTRFECLSFHRNFILE